MAEFDRTKFLKEVTGVDVERWHERYRRLMKEGRRIPSRGPYPQIAAPRPQLDPVLRYEGRNRIIAISNPDDPDTIWRPIEVGGSTGWMADYRPKPDKRILEIDPDLPIDLIVKLPTCGKVEPRLRLITQMSGGHEVGMGYERRWGRHVREGDYSYPGAVCSNQEYVLTVDDEWVCPECGRLR